MISEQDQRHYLAVACRAVGEAAQLVRTHAPGKLTEKGDRDPASEVDLAVERSVRDFLHNKTPEVGFLGEEEGGQPTGHGLLWMLDPIDGTVNFLHGLSLCAVSLSLYDANTVVVAVIDLPFIGTQYTAVLGQGAYADGKRLRVSHTSTLANALISIDQYAFGDDAERKNRLRLTERLAHDAQRVRMLGASAIDLAWTAEGRLDAASCSATSHGTPAPACSSPAKPERESLITTAPNTPNSPNSPNSPCPRSRSRQRWKPS
jgi:myo-inositol-1(or 4)-monophosphatase